MSSPARIVLASVKACLERRDLDLPEWRSARPAIASSTCLQQLLGVGLHELGPFLSRILPETWHGHQQKTTSFPPGAKKEIARLSGGFQNWETGIS
eukprot:6168688-Pleurochrysis_carterae.AAC.2